MQHQPVHKPSPSSKKWLLVGPTSLLLLSLLVESSRQDLLGAATVVAAVAWLILVVAGFAAHPRAEKLLRFTGIAILIAALCLFVLWLLRRA
jgi:hypothetical protein